MILTTGEPNHIEDYLITVRNGQWFGWTDSKNKIYENLIVHDGGYKPTEDEVNAGYQALKDNWNNTKYVRDRQDAYPYFSEQLDLLYHDMKDGKLGVAATTGSWFVGITSVKNDIPKPS